MTSDMPRRKQEPRAADTDRIQLAQLLTKAASQGELPMNEYEDRLSKVYAAQTYTELDRLSADLPDVSLSRRKGGVCQPAPKALVMGVLSGFERRGRWNVPNRLTLVALCGSGLVDLRYADFTSPEVEIRAYSIMGGQTILVPPEVNVEVRGHGIMGSFDHDAGGPGTPGAPKIVIRGLFLLGESRHPSQEAQAAAALSAVSTDQSCQYRPKTAQCRRDRR